MEKAQLVGQINEICSPPSATPSSTVAMNSLGLVVTLAADHTLDYFYSRQTSIRKRRLAIRGGVELLQKHMFSHIKFSLDGHLLLLWSSSSIGVVEIASNGTNQLGPCNFFALGERVINGQSPLSTIVKVLFHPFSPNHVLVLCERGALYVMDLVSRSHQKIPLNLEFSFVSFAVGPRIDWLAVSVLLLSQNGEIFVLCPVLPVGAALDEGLVSDLYAWTKERESEARSFDSPLRDYSNFVQTYLLSAFGTGLQKVASDYRDKDYRSDDPADRKLLQVGGEHENGNFPFMRHRYQPSLALSSTYHSSPAASGSSPGRLSYDFVTATSLPELQGPLFVANLSDCQDRGSFQQLKKQPVDICIPTDKRANGGSPVFVVSFDDASLEVYCIGEDDDTDCSPRNPAESIGPSFLIDELFPMGESAILSSPLPSLVLLESVKISSNLPHSSKENSPSLPMVNLCDTDEWSMSCDPVLPDSLIVSGRKSCVAFLVSFPWLEEQQNESSHGSSDEEGNPTSVIPLYSPGAMGSTVLLSSSDGRSLQICGLVVSVDAVLGHVVLIHTSDGRLMSIKLTMFVRQWELSSSRKKRRELLNSRIPTAAELDQNHQADHDQRALALIRATMIGLGTIPSLDYSEKGNAGDSRGREAVSLASEHLRREVLLPMTELRERLQQRTDQIGSLYRAQKEFVDGVNGDPTKIGLKEQLKLVNKQSVSAAERLSRLKENFSLQQHRATEALQLLYRLRCRMGPGEINYNKQLRSWSKEAVVMEAQLSALETMAQQSVDGLHHGAQATFGEQSMEMHKSPKKAPARESPHRSQKGEVATSTPSLARSTYAGVRGQKMGYAPKAAQFLAAHVKTASPSTSYYRPSSLSSTALNGAGTTEHRNPDDLPHKGGSVLSAFRSAPSFPSASQRTKEDSSPPITPPKDVLNTSILSSSSPSLSPWSSGSVLADSGGLSSHDIELCCKLQSAQAELLAHSKKVVLELETRLRLLNQSI